MTETRRRQYDNVRIRVRPDQLDYLDELLHVAWATVSSTRARVKGTIPDENELVRLMNAELRLINSIQEELKRARSDLDARAPA